MKDEELGVSVQQADDIDAYDLILKDKERLLSFEEPTRFIFRILLYERVGIIQTFL